MKKEKLELPVSGPREESPDTTPNDISIENAYGLYNESKTVTVNLVYREGFDQEKTKFILKID